MSSPKEKAKELFTNYLILFPEFYNDLEYGYNDLKAKQCALIAVDEVQQLIKDLSSCKNRFIYIIDEMNYWQEVKQEIQKL